MAWEYIEGSSWAPLPGWTDEKKTNNANEFRNFFAARGWSLEAICGMLGNVEKESFINPAQQQGDNGPGYGLVQWDPKSKLTDWLTPQGIPAYDGTGQCRWIDEYTLVYGQWTTYAFNISFNDFKVSTESPEYLCNVFLRNFERPANPAASLVERQGYARKWYDYFYGTEPGPGPGPGPTPTDKHRMPIIFYLKRRY